MSRSFGIAAGRVSVRRWSGADAPGDLVRLVVDLDLPEAGVVLVYPGRNHVDGRLAAGGVEAAADGLPVDRVVVADRRLGHGVDPHSEGLLELVGVQRGENAAEGVAAQRPALGWLGMPSGRSRNDSNHSMLELPKSSISVQCSAPQMTEQTAMTMMSCSSWSRVRSTRGSRTRWKHSRTGSLMAVPQSLWTLDMGYFGSIRARMEVRCDSPGTGPSPPFHAAIARSSVGGPPSGSVNVSRPILTMLGSRRVFDALLSPK